MDKLIITDNYRLRLFEHSYSVLRCVAHALPYFPDAWTIEDNGACFIVKDHNGQALA
jgi:hypothetical protein